MSIFIEHYTHVSRMILFLFLACYGRISEFSLSCTKNLFKPLWEISIVYVFLDITLGHNYVTNKKIRIYIHYNKRKYSIVDRRLLFSSSVSQKNKRILNKDENIESH